MPEITIKLPTPHAGQLPFCKSLARFRVLMCGRRWGKSVVCKKESVEETLRGRYVSYTTPTFLLARMFHKELEAILDPRVFTFNRSDLLIECKTGGFIKFFTGERLDAMRGLKFHHAILDEASFIPDLEEGWNNSIRPTLTDYRGRGTFISTPKGRNFFNSLYLRGKNGEHGWQSFHQPTSSNPYIHPDEIAEAKRQLPDAVFRQEYMAEPLDNAANPFGGPFIRAAISLLSSKPAKVYGIDLAKSYDWTVIIGLDEDGRVCHFERFQKDWRGTKDAILRLDRRAEILIDSTGVGDPITEDLQAQGLYNIHGFKFTSESKQSIMLGLAAAIQQSKISYPAGVIVDELEMFEYQYTARGVRYSAPSGFHDDSVCALALAYRCLVEHAPKTGEYYLL